MDQHSRSDPLAAARDLGPIIAAAADEIERTQRIPAPLLAQLHQARLFRMLLPRSAGGDAIEPGTYLRTVEEVAQHDGSVGWCLFTGNSSALMAAYLPPEVAREIWGDRCAAVAWGPPNASTAQAVPGGYRVSGTWQFASGCRHAQWMGAHCRVAEPDGSLRMNRFGRPTVRSLLFPASRATLLDGSWDVIGLRGTASDAYSVTDLFVPEAFSSTREDPTLRREPGRLYAFTVQGLYAVGAAGVALGLARAMLDGFIALARRKTPRALGPLAGNAVVQAGVARAEARFGAARTWLLATLEAIWAEADDVAPIDIAARARLRLATVHAIEAAIEVADYAYRAAGADAIFAGSAFERRFRDMHTLSQQTQARLAHFEAVGQVMLGTVPESFL
ncbi:MAG TPA: acyl-CoA dehydrogenase family protein [Acetobacteraceae bacterium]|nr:acyl-CoA dehydrogenase family protein [Acetobacteraceae bacterium]